MLNSLSSQQQQAVSQQLSIEQLLRAAKLIEQRAIIEKLPQQFQVNDGFTYAKFGGNRIFKLSKKKFFLFQNF